MNASPTSPSSGTARRRLPSILTALTLAVSGATTAALTAAPPAAAAGGRLSVGPGSYVGGQALTWSGSIGASGVRTVRLQFHMGRPGDTWSDDAQFAGARTRADGSFRFVHPAPSMQRIHYRVVSGSLSTSAVTLNAKSQDLTISLAGSDPEKRASSAPVRLAPGERFGIDVDTTPENIFRSPDTENLPVLEGRTLQLQERGADGRSWTTLATTTVDRDGEVRFSGLTEEAGVHVYRVRAADYTVGGSEVGWIQSFPMLLHVGADAHAALASAQRSADAVRSVDVGPRSRTSTRPARNGAQNYRWYPPRFDFAWEYGESLTARPPRGTALRGRWLDQVTGAGRVQHHNGGLSLESKRSSEAGPGDFGTTAATLRGNALTYGRWEARMRVANMFERGGPDYKVAVELIPARARDYRCGARNITVGSFTPWSRTVKFGVRNAKRSWTGSAQAPSLAYDGAYVLSVEVARDHITWLLNGNPVGTVRSSRAVPKVPMTMRLSLQGRGDDEMNQVIVNSDWQRAYPISTGRKAYSSRGLASRAAAPACG